MIVSTKETVAVFEKKPSYSIGKPDYDGLWKKIIGELFEEFILFFAPDLYEKIDFAKGPEFLQQELYKEVIQEKKGRNIADQIIKVYLKNGEEQWILIHVEVQGQLSEMFSKRMFRYFYRIYDKFDREIYAIALITGDKVSKGSDHFHYSFHGTTLDYRYNLYKFHEHETAELKQSANPFATAVIAAKYASQYKYDEEKRFYFKRRLMKQIINRFSGTAGKSRIYLKALIYFIDYLLHTPDELKSRLSKELANDLGKEGVNEMRIEETELSPVMEGMAEILSVVVKKRFAKKLFNENFSDEKIAELADLELEEVVALRKEMQKNHK